MPRYNVQKRQTLDRLTLKFQLQAREVLRRQTQGLVRDVYDSLEAGARSFTPRLAGLDDRLDSLFQSHRSRVVHVAVSDGIQEVTPGNDPKLGLWEAFPDTAWIEDTLSVSLASERDRIRDRLVDKWAEKHQRKIADLANVLLDDYAKALRKAYRILAGDWVAGESTVEDVAHRLKRVVQVSDSSAKEIFQTGTTNYFNETRHDYFSTNTSVDYMQFYAVTDGRISNMCEARHEFVFPIAEASDRDFMPAIHPWCRSIQRPLISALLTHLRIIEAHLITAAQKSALPPTAWEHVHAA